MKNKINMLSFEDYSSSLSYNEERGYYEYVGCNNHCIIRKGSFVHLMASMGKRDFAVLDAYSCGLSKEENVRSNRGMREVLQASYLHAYCLVCRTQAGTVARHYLVERPDAMPSDEFERCMADCLKAGLCRDRAALYRRQSEPIQWSRQWMHYIIPKPLPDCKMPGQDCITKVRGMSIRS